MTGTNRQSEPVGHTGFLANLKKSGIVSVDRIDAALAEFHGAKTASDSEVLPVARHLIAADLITHWQYEKLIQGRYKGFHLGKYRLLDHLGTGGMSTVYLAEHSLTGQKRALKVLPRKRMSERSYLARFYREGRAIAALDHPNIVRIYDIADEGNTHYMVMEFVDGIDLYDLVSDRGPLDFEMARDCVIQAARGLSHAHEKQLIHRDIKPANLFRTVSGTVKVLDLGLALLKSDDDEHGLSKQHDERTMGTADYLAPEQAINSHDVDQRADIYSLGCTLFYLLTGRPPFNEGSLAQRIAMHQAKQPPAIDSLRPGCPPYLAAACEQMMQKEAQHRFQHCDEVIAALETRSMPGRSTAVEFPDSTTALPISPDLNRAPNSSDRTFSTIRARKHKRIPVGLVAMIAVLAIVPPVLAFFALYYPTRPDSNNEADTTVEMEGNNIPIPDLAGTQSLESSAIQTGIPRPVATIDPNATDLNVFTDFENRAPFSDGKKRWDLIESGVVVGTLRNEGKCKVVKPPEFSPKEAGQYCLLIPGDSDDVEFRPEHPDARISRLRFLACRATDTLPFEFEIQAKSNRQFERWKTVYSVTELNSTGEFREIDVGPEHFDVIDSRKFRFKTTGGIDGSVCIDNLRIELK